MNESNHKQIVAALSIESAPHPSHRVVDRIDRIYRIPPSNQANPIPLILSQMLNVTSAPTQQSFRNSGHFSHLPGAYGICESAPIIMKTNLTSLVLTIVSFIGWNPKVGAQPVALQQATATYSQLLSGRWTVDLAIDADLINTGWAVQQPDHMAGLSQTAVFETAQDVGFTGATELTFRLSTRSVNSDGAQNLGRFRLSVTSDERSEFADGLVNNGDVAANWEVLEPLRFQSASGAVLDKLPDLSLLASGTNALVETYTVVVRTTSPRITGVRLEVLHDDSLPGGGPGRGPEGNFVLMDFRVSAVPAAPDLRATTQVSCVDVCWPGLTNKSYQVQYSSALTSNQWINLGLPIQGNGANCVTDAIRNSERRFYRVTEAS
jgi:hypothetical protein